MPLSIYEIMIRPERVKNLLVVRNDRFGEFLLNIPAFRALKESFPQAKITAVVNASVQELARRVVYLDEILVWDKPRVRDLRRFDMAVMFNPNKQFNIAVFLAGIPVRVGYNRKWGFLLTHKITDDKAIGLFHEVEYNLRLAGLAGAKTADTGLNIAIGSQDDPGYADFFGGTQVIVSLHPWSSDPVKLWPVENFVGLAKKIISEFKAKVVIVGGRQEAPKSGVFSGDNILNLTGKTTLPQLAFVLKKSAVLVSADSGPVHLACSQGTPVVALFRNDIPGKSSLRWGPWGKGNSVIAKPRLEDISVDEVAQRVRAVIQR